jgi:hypothetical protein
VRLSETQHCPQVVARMGHHQYLYLKGTLLLERYVFESYYHYSASGFFSVHTFLLCSFGQCTQTRNFGALMLIASIQNDGRGGNLDSTTSHSTLALEYVSDNNSPLLRLPMLLSGSCKSSTQLMDQPYRKDDCPVIGNW